MDGQHFDSLARRLGTRRMAIGGALAGLLLPLDAVVRGKAKKRKSKGTGKGKAKGRTNAQAEPCWRAGTCIVSKGSNISQCDLEGYTAPDGLGCTRCNLSRANLRRADLTGVDFTRANLSGACLVDADFTGATFANNTNLYNAIFCRTIMPDGSVNNSGCGSPTVCCPTCIATGLTCGPGIGGACCSGQCTNGICGTCTPTTCVALGRTCGSHADGCGGILNCGTCDVGQVCAPPGRCARSCTPGGSPAQCPGCFCVRPFGTSGGVCVTQPFTCAGASCENCGAGMVCVNGTAAVCTDNRVCIPACT